MAAGAPLKRISDAAVRDWTLARPCPVCRSRRRGRSGFRSGPWPPRPSGGRHEATLLPHRWPPAAPGLERALQQKMRCRAHVYDEILAARWANDVPASCIALNPPATVRVATFLPRRDIASTPPWGPRLSAIADCAAPAGACPSRSIRGCRRRARCSRRSSSNSGRTFRC